MISTERNLDKYTAVTIVQQGGTALDKLEDITGAAKAIFSTIGADLADLNQGKSQVGVPLDKYYTHFTMKEGVKIPGYDLFKVNTFQATSGNNFKCYFTDELLADFKICTHCLKTADFCIHSKAGGKRPVPGASSRADARRRAIAKYDQRP